MNRAERSSHPPASLRKTDGEILFAADRVTHLAAISPGDGRVYASPREIADQCRMDLFAVGEDSNGGALPVSLSFAIGRKGIQAFVFAYYELLDGLALGTTLHTGHKVDD